MHIYNLHEWRHTHHFSINNSEGEKNTRRVIFLTFSMMVVEIAAGLAYGSMALLADGWHMGTHAAALGISAFAYWYARRHASDPRYSFGTGKVGVLGGFASAVVLVLVALLMGVESVKRLASPQPIQFDEAIVVAILGLVVNIVSALFLKGNGVRAHKHDFDKNHHHDYNLRAAYLHVVADAFTSFLAIVALLSGRTFGWIWMDPIMGIVGAVIIARWSYGLLRDTSKILLDSGVDRKIMAKIRSVIESDSDSRISDLHVWPVGSQHLAAIISIVTHYPKPVEYYKGLLVGFEGLEHVTVEINGCSSEPCLAGQTGYQRELRTRPA